MRAFICALIVITCIALAIRADYRNNYMPEIQKQRYDTIVLRGGDSIFIHGDTVYSATNSFLVKEVRIGYH